LRKRQHLDAHAIRLRYVDAIAAACLRPEHQLIRTRRQWRVVRSRLLRKGLAGRRTVVPRVTWDYLVLASFESRAWSPAPLFASSRSNTAATISGRPTVASTKTSANLPPSSGGTNLPHEIASLYGLPESP